LGPPLAPGDMGEREPVAQALRSGGDQAEAGPVVEPAVDEGQLWRGRLDEYGGQGGAGDDRERLVPPGALVHPGHHDCARSGFGVRTTMGISRPWTRCL
jgi:hypothetical protein